MTFSNQKLLSLVAIAFLISLLEDNRTVALPVEQTGALDQLVELEAERLISFNPYQLQNEPEEAENQLIEQLGQFASSITHTLSAGRNAQQLQDQLANAIDIADIIHKAKSREIRREQLRNRGVSDALEASKPHILHNHHLSDTARHELVKFAESQPKEQERIILLQLFAHADLPEVGENVEDNHHHNNHHEWSKIFNDVRGFVEKTVNVAIDLTDELYLSPVFLEYLPIIGTGITRLKLAGQTTYEVIKVLRSFKKFLHHYNELPNDSGHLSKLKHLFTSDKGMRMFNRQGLESLHRLVEKLVKRYEHQKRPFNDHEKKEVMNRSAHFLLMTVCQAISNIS